MRVVKRSSGHIALLFTNIIFGLNLPIVRSLMPDVISSLSLNFFRMAGAAVLFWITSLFIKRSKIPLRDIFLLFFAGMLGILINQLSFIIGFSTVTPVTASLLITLLPVVTMILSFFIQKEPISIMKVIGVSVGASGALLLILDNASGHGQSSVKGILLILFSTTCYALYLTLFKRLVSTYHPVHLMKWMFLFSVILSLPVCYNDFINTPFSELNTSTYLRIAFVVIMATFVTYLLIPVGQKTVRPTTLSMYNYLQPVIASVIAIVVGMDSFGFKNVLSAVLVFAGVYIVTQSKSKIQMEMQRRRRNIMRIRKAKEA